MDGYTVGFMFGLITGIVLVGGLVILNQKMRLQEWSRRG
jgi:hypothetical protein